MLTNYNGNRKPVILITGGTKGLGMELAAEFIKIGAVVIVTSRFCEFNATTNIHQNKPIKQQLDVRNEISVKRLFEWISLNKLKIDILINNAGVGIFKPFTELSIEDWHNTIQTNLTGPFYCIKAAYDQMKSNGGGRIINIGSIAETVPLKNNISYGVSKCGLKALSAMLNEESKHDKIRITHITLGAVYTEIWKSRPEFSKDDMLDPKRTAKVIVNLAFLPLDIRIDNIEILPEKGIL